MDSLHVEVTKTTNSKSSSRSGSPCRPRIDAHHDASMSLNSPGPQGTSTPSASLSGKDIYSNSVPLSMRIGSSSATSNFQGRPRSPTATRKDSEETPITPQRGLLFEQNTTLDDSNVTSTQLSEEDTERHISLTLASLNLSNGSSENVPSCDETDITPGTNKSDRAAIEHLQNKITRTREFIRLEQTTRDDNVNEYLKLAANADKQQLHRIKAVFEKKNQKSAHSISQLQKKLDVYTRRMQDTRTQGLTQNAHRQPREVLRDMGQGLKNVGGNIRDGLTGFSGSVMSKPREFAHLIKNKFGSADNINQLSSTWYIGNGADGASGDGSCPDKTHHGSATLPGGCTLNSGSSIGHSAMAIAKFPSEEGSECSSVTSDSIPGYHGTREQFQGASSSINSLKPIFNELQERREDYERLRQKLDRFGALQQEIQFLSSAVQEERFRSERLEEQVNDLTELHQNEVENLKQALADMEEKVQYQSEERLRDIHEMLEHCQTKICKMEHQAQQQQQYVTLEGIDNSNARALVVKLINVVLTVLQVVLLLVATAAGITMPFLRTRVRILTTILLVLAIVLMIRQWPEVRDIGAHMMQHLKDALGVTDNKIM